MSSRSVVEEEELLFLSLGTCSELIMHGRDVRQRGVQVGLVDPTLEPGMPQNSMSIAVNQAPSHASHDVKPSQSGALKPIWAFQISWQRPRHRSVVTRKFRSPSRNVGVCSGQTCKKSSQQSSKLQQEGLQK